MESLHIHWTKKDKNKNKIRLMFLFQFETITIHYLLADLCKFHNCQQSIILYLCFTLILCLYFLILSFIPCNLLYPSKCYELISYAKERERERKKRNKEYRNIFYYIYFLSFICSVSLLRNVLKFLRFSIHTCLSFIVSWWLVINPVYLFLSFILISSLYIYIDIYFFFSFDLSFNSLTSFFYFTPSFLSLFSPLLFPISSCRYFLSANVIPAQKDW